jgi:CubicO group peptidase (beta-lactamase class C family)
VTRRLPILERLFPGALAFVLATLLLCGCTAAYPPEAPVGPDDLAAALLPAVQLEGEDPVRLTLAERMAHYNVPGVSVAVMEGGEVVWAQGWGVADTKTGAPVTPHTLFQAASISKPVAALAAMAFVEDGLLELDGPVNRHLTGWTLPDNGFTADSAVTLRGLLTHTAGLTVWGFPGYRKDRPFADAETGERALATNAEVLDGLGNTAAVRVYKVPGTSWQYSGGGYTVMEQMLEDVTGLPFDAVMQERVLGPAGMTRSTYAQPLPADRWDEAARGHRGDGSEVEGEWHNYPEQAAAGLWTTPTDLLLLSAHLRGILHGDVSGGVVSGVVSHETLQAMMAPHRAGEEGFSDYGLGFAIGGEGDDTTFGHGGANAGFRAQWVVYGARGQGAVVMTNGDQGAALAGEILRGLSGLYGWPGHRPEIRSRRLVSAEELAAYAGDYRLVGQQGTVVSVTPGEGTLILDVPGQGSYTLHGVPGAPDEFFDASDGQAVVFERGPGGEVTAMVAGGRARFERVGREGAR